MDEAKKKAIYLALSQPFPPEAIQRASGSQTGKGYDCTGYGVQYILNRVNEVCGIGAMQVRRQMKVREFTRASGKVAYECVCEATIQLGEWTNGHFVAYAEALADGGHISATEADARKGAYTNALKKGLAQFGAGRQAYEGSIDDDFLPSDDVIAARTPKAKPQPTKPPTKPQPAKVEAPQAVQKTPEAPAPTHPMPFTATPGHVMSVGQRLGVKPDAVRAMVQKAYGVSVDKLTPNQCAECAASMIASQSAGQAIANGAQVNGAVHA